MRVLQTSDFAKSIRKAHPKLETLKVEFVDDDGCLCLHVKHGNFILAVWDSGYDGHHPVNTELQSILRLLETDLRILNFKVN